MSSRPREGSLEAPTRHVLDWKNPEFYNEESLFKELERVFDICHGCRRCVSLCNSFPTLFDLVDESETMEVDGVAKQDYWKVVDHCYLCDMCYMSKCPYVPPHEWNLDFPHVMLRAKAVKFKKGDFKPRDKWLTATDKVGSLAGIPVVNGIVNAVNQSGAGRKIVQKMLGVHPDAVVPKYHTQTAHKRFDKHQSGFEPKPHDDVQGRVAIFTTCYGNYNMPDLVGDMIAVFEHNKIPVKVVQKSQCCGMPKLELGDLESVEKAVEANAPALLEMIDAGYDIVAPIPSCVLMFKQELPLMFPNDARVKKIREHLYDPFEYLMRYQKAGKLNTEFKNKLGKISYHAACHLRVQNIGLKTRDLLNLIPDTQIDTIERCSGHDGTYAVKEEFHDISMKICRPVVTKVKNFAPDYYASDCPMAGEQIENGLDTGMAATHPLSLLRKAYGI